MKEGKFQNAMKQFAAAIQRPTIIPSLIGVFIMAGAVLSFDFMPAPVRLAGRLITMKTFAFVMIMFHYLFHSL